MLVIVSMIQDLAIVQGVVLIVIYLMSLALRMLCTCVRHVCNFTKLTSVFRFTHRHYELLIIGRFGLCYVIVWLLI